MLHRSKVDWPCLSIDFLIRERCCPEGPSNPGKWFPSQVLGNLDQAAGNTTIDKQGRLKHKDDNFPLCVYMVAGSSAEKKSDNRIYAMKWSEMHKTLHEDDEFSDSEEDEANHIEPTIRYETVQHRGSINRIRSLHGSPLVATWNEDAEVGIYNIAPAVEELDRPVSKKDQKKNFQGCKVAGFKNKQEGFALEWSPKTFGRLAAGTCDAALWIYTPADENCSSFVKENAVGLQGHTDSIEDI